jgi:SAM-dependent methyltransferase
MASASMAKPTTSQKIPAGAGLPTPAVPSLLFHAIDQVAREELGAQDRAGEGLAEEVRALSTLYTQRREEIGEDDRTGLVAARLRFFLPRDLPKITLPLFELWRAGLLPAQRRWRVLDLGSGLGATSLGVARFARAMDAADVLELTAVDSWARGKRLLEALVQKLPREDFAEVRLTARIGAMQDAGPKGPFDLVVLGLSLNEWARGKQPRDAASLLSRLGERLAPGGSLIVIEPALRPEARFLQRTRDALSGELRVFAPCVSGAPCPMLANERDWCHAELGGELEGGLAQIARRAGLRRSRRTFAYLTLRRDEENARDIAPPNGYRVVSEVLSSKGKREVFVCGDGALVRLRVMNRDLGDVNEDLKNLRRGDLIGLDRALPRESGGFRLRAEDALRRSR